MSAGEIATLVAQVALVVGGGGAFWAYWRERKVNKAKGTVATATVELQIDQSRMQNLEQRFALAEKAWDGERASFQRRIDALEQDLADERREAVEEKERHDTQLRALEDRVAAMQHELAELYQELGRARQRNGVDPDS